MYERIDSQTSNSGIDLSNYHPDSVSIANDDGDFPSLDDPRRSTASLCRSSVAGSRTFQPEPQPFPLKCSQELLRDVLKPRPVRALRHGHTRTRSATASTDSPPFILADYSRRTRASSLSGNNSGMKSSYTYPMTLPRGFFPRAEPVLSVATEVEETIGSFSPTSCPRQHLHDILDTFAPPPRRKSGLRVVTRPDKGKSRSRDPSPSRSISPPLSPIPSICRTPSSYSESEYFPTAPSSAGPATPVHSNVSSPQLQNKALRPILEALEDASKFRVETPCASCGKVGSNYPCCPRCGEMWCSRACRVRTTAGKRHVCGRKPSPN